jgi:hypothetical protein
VKPVKPIPEGVEMFIGKLEIVMHNSSALVGVPSALRLVGDFQPCIVKLGEFSTKSGNRDLGHNLLPPWRWEM